MSGRMRCCVIAALWLTMASICAHGAEVRAWLDRNAMQLGETVTLNVEVANASSDAKPDFSALESDFNLSGTQSSSSINIINGQSSSKLLWAVALEPKRAGALTIPPLSVAGQDTQPLTLTVQAATAASGKAGDDVYIETTIEPRSPYVQQQVSMTVKLYFSVNLTDGSLDDPQAPGLIVRKVGGQDSNFAADVGGRRYRVLERRYVVQAEKSGSVAVPSIVFRGHAMDRNDANSFFSRGHNVSAHSDPITLDVRPRPANAGADAWLPARTVTLTADGIDANTTAQVGEPLTLTLRLQANGLGFEQLPELTLPKIDGADIYPDKASTQNKDSGDLTTGERERKFAIVPKRAGPLVIPSISIGWWDTAHDRPETATVPEIDLTVQAAAGSAPQTASPVPSVTAAPLPAAAAPPIADNSHTTADAEAAFWRALALAAIGLWIATAAGWIVWSARQQKKSAAKASQTDAANASDGSAKKSFRGACAAGDWAAVSRVLLAWAHSKKIAARNLRELGEAVNDPAQIAAIEQLERVRYGTATEDGLKEQLTAAFRNGPHFPKTMAAAASAVLPHLYPSQSG
ncbi:MAG TPA: BatD family protein [Rudaea sp.]|jgi:hypothetical protein|nr:BatD family protein [Rudaea sp.]